MVEGHAAEDDHKFQEGEMPEVALLGGRVAIRNPLVLSNPKARSIGLMRGACACKAATGGVRGTQGDFASTDTSLCLPMAGSTSIRAMHEGGTT
ncbi:hypothetical protein VTO73DRAFT_8728 [Trametes versicolor]